MEDSRWGYDVSSRIYYHTIHLYQANTNYILESILSHVRDTMIRFDTKDMTVTNYWMDYRDRPAYVVHDIDRQEIRCLVRVINSLIKKHRGE